ncbi:glycine oxidase ThiO [Paenibacillus thailandensis]|uniref:glycine oxidase n=1 Tax=Paenibacillus thailandensis TaxID=393250 RepID=A0ABW5QT32_9BACL
MTAQTVLVLGGGIIGLSCAFRAAAEGMQVTVAEPAACGGQASGAAAGMLAAFSENTDQPDAFFQLCLASLNCYPDWIAEVEEASGERAEWVRSGSLTLLNGETDLLHALSRISWQNDWGASAELVEGEALRKLEPALADSIPAAVYIPGESHVYAPKLVRALEKACRRLGVRIADHAGAPVGLTRLPGGGIEARCERLPEPLVADKAVICAGAWTGLYERWLGIPFPVQPVRGQICSFEVPFGQVRHIVFSNQAYWVGKQNNRLVCGASEDAAGFDTSVTERGINRLIRSGERTLPFLSGKETASRWAGLRPVAPDGLPLIGPVSGTGDIVMAAGHYRNGILLSPATARIVADLLREKPPGPISAFAPDRFAVAAKND